MTAPDEHEIVAVDRASELAMTAADEVVAVTNWLDSDGDECGPDDAVVCVVPRPDGLWACVDLRDFEPRVAH